MPVEDVLNKIPKNTPVWAVGLVTTLVCLVVCAAAFYVVIRPELIESMKVEAAARTHTQGLETNNQQFLMNLITNLTKQVTDLTIRVSALERDNTALEAAKAALDAKVFDCENKLKSCKR